MGTQSSAAGLRVSLIIENTIHRYGIEGMIRSLNGISSVHSVSFGLDEIRTWDGQQFDLVLAAADDLETDEARDAIRALCNQGMKVLLLIDGPDGLDASWLAHIGAQGFVDWTGLEPRILADAVADVTAGKFHVSSSLARRLLGRAGPNSLGGVQPWGPAGATLTPRELQVLRLVAEGLSNKQVSRQLQISEHGVKRLVGNVLAKLNCPNRTLAVVRAMEDGLLAV
ncbi:DNA-binding NarL/FixJ family response regulator [Streptomyces sp. SAI-126]|nr:DNA-binding NarL/FixJ family response regulator [Streptomyces sp. SAI-119]MDH6494906.1 DNA-binding NarL/FixJ family response regulator [Streptomyces sp. SAI-149]